MGICFRLALGADKASYQIVVLGEFVVVRSIRAIEPALGGSALHWFSQLASCLVNGKDVVRRSHSMPYPYGC